MPVQTRSQTALAKATNPQESLPRNAKGYPSVGGLTIQKKNRLYRIMRSYGSIYEGEMISRKKDGKGIMIDSYGSVYEGDWINDLKHGKGKITHTDGTYYEGEWKNNFKHGKGKNTYTNGSYYEGEWKNNILISIDRIGTTKDCEMPTDLLLALQLALQKNK